MSLKLFLTSIFLVSLVFGLASAQSGSDPVISDASPSNNTNLHHDEVRLSVDVSDPDDQSLTGSFVNRSSGEVLKSFSVDGNNSVSFEWDVTNDEELKWMVNVTDGANTVSKNYRFSTYDVELDWNDNSSVESGFRIYSNASGSGFSVLEEVAADSESYVAASDSLDTGMFVCYRVSAFNSQGESSVSESCVDTDNLA